MQKQNNKPVDLRVHGKIGEAIYQAKRTMFAFHKHGMPLRQALDSFGMDIAKRFDEIIRGIENEPLPATTSSTQERKPLSDETIEQLTLTVCGYGDDAEKHAEALLVLLDEIQESKRAADIAWTAKRIAFQHCSEQVMDAQVELLRGEIVREGRHLN